MESLDLAKWNAVLRKYRISFDAETSRTKWPRHLRNTFESIRKLGMQQWDEYTEDISATILREPWRSQRRQRANELIMEATECSKERVNEDTWRARIEHIIAERFSIDVACKECKGRLWRSEQEVVPTSSADESAVESHEGLLQRQKNREPCKCPNGPEEKLDGGTTQLFVNCVNEGIVYPEEVRRDIGKKRESKPDRVFCIRQTKTIERLLHSEDRRPLHSGKTLRETVRTSPFRPSVGPFLFPFLVLESKSAKGKDAFTDIENQTVFPIREILRLQEELQLAAEEAADIRWDAAPLVWFLAHRGESWRLMASYPEQGPEGTSYHVTRLWSGDIDTRTGALQFVLVLDFICDWARDMFRDMIKKSLRALASSIGERSTVSFSDVLSLNGPRRSWHTTIADIHHRESTPSCYTEKDPFRAFDMGRCVIRDIRFIRSRILGVCVTEETLDTLLMGTRTDKESKQVAKEVLQLLRRSGFIVEKASLDVLELSWTGKERSGLDELPQDRRFIVAASAAAYLTSDWEQSREIFFIAVDETTVQPLCEQADVDETMSAALLGKMFVKQKPFVEFFSRFQRHSALHNMMACATSSYLRVLPFRRQGFLLETKRPPRGYPDADEALIYDGCVGELVYNLCKSHTIGRIKPSSTLFRRSNRLDLVPVVISTLSDELEILTTSLWPLDDDIDFTEYRDSKVLFAETTRIEGPKFCAVIMDPTQRPLREHLRMVQRGAGSSRFHLCSLVHSSDGWVRERNRDLRTRTSDMDEIVASFAAQLGDLPAVDQTSSPTDAKEKEGETEAASVEHPQGREGEVATRGTRIHTLEAVEDDEASTTLSTSATATTRRVRKGLDRPASLKVTHNTSNSSKSDPDEDRPVRRSKRLSSRHSNEHSEQTKLKAQEHVVEKAE